MTHVKINQRVIITKPGKQQGRRGVVEKITDEDIAMVRTDSHLVPCFFSEIEEDLAA